MSAKKHFRGILLFAIITNSSVALNADRYDDYVSKYWEMAVDQQERYGIPASITLAQGLLESAAGRSTLAAEGNNHFGIKCHSDWQGATMLRSDDMPDECFRVYADPSESFEDHSRFLSRKRYQPLFGFDVTDYTSWAQGLHTCGYATDPNYAERLISIIERYGLYDYDTAEGRTGESVAGFILNNLRSSHLVRKNNGLHYVIAAPGDRYSTIAGEFGMDLSRLLLFNDADADCEIKEWEEVYLEQKRELLEEGAEWATIGEDESLHSLSQRFGIRVSTLKTLNPRAIFRPGTKIRLR